MAKRQIKLGVRFGMLIVHSIKPSVLTPKSPDRDIVTCDCDCGKRARFVARQLQTDGHSCGCVLSPPEFFDTSGVFHRSFRSTGFYDNQNQWIESPCVSRKEIL